MSEILAALTPFGNAQKAADMARYHKSDRVILGVSNPDIDTAVRAWRDGRSIAEMCVEADALWRSGVFEARIAAAKLLTKARIREDEDSVWRLIVSWVPDFDGWAIADHAASAGDRRLMAHLERLDHVETWTRSDHLWTKRAALIFTLPLAKLTHPSEAEAAARDRVLGWAADYVPDQDWFIQKAIAWWLRTLSVRNPEHVRAFLARHGSEMKAFARKDAGRKLG